MKTVTIYEDKHRTIIHPWVRSPRIFYIVKPMNGKFTYRILRNSGFCDSSDVLILLGYANTEEDAVRKVEKLIEFYSIEEMLNSLEVHPLYSRKDVLRLP